MVIAAFAIVRRPTVIGVRSGVVPIGAIVRVSVAFLPGAILVMRERHALSPDDCGHALERNGQSQQKHSKKAEETFRHRRAL